MGNRTSGIMHWVETKVLNWAYGGMIIGLVVRAVSLILSSSIPYSAWPLLLRLSVEGVAAFGMVGCSDIVFSVSSSKESSLSREMDAVRTSEDYIPNARLSPAKLAQQKIILDMRRELALAGLRRDRNKQIAFGMGPSGLTMLIYGLLFAASVMGQSTGVALITDLIAVFATLSTTYYISALHQEPKPDPIETAKSIANEAIEARLQAARDRLAKGDETPEDLDLLDGAQAGNTYQRSLVRKMRKLDTSIEWLTASDCYTRYDVTTASAQTTLRRRVRDLGKAGKHGVTWDETQNRWMVPRTQLDYVFPPEFLARLRALQTPNKPRTIHRPRGGRQADAGESTSDTIRALPDAGIEQEAQAVSLN